MSTTSERLEYLRGELRAERISYAELAELQSLAAHIHPSDVELLEAAGVPENATEDAPTRRVVVITGKQGPTFGDRPSWTEVNLTHPAWGGSVSWSRVTHWPRSERSDALRAAFESFSRIEGEYPWM